MRRTPRNLRIACNHRGEPLLSVCPAKSMEVSAESAGKSATGHIHTQLRSRQSPSPWYDCFPHRGGSMPMTPFMERFPEVGARETRSVTVINRQDLPDGEYGFLEVYCIVTSPDR